MDSATRSVELERKQIGRFLIGAVVATGLATIVLTLVAVRVFQSRVPGDLLVSTAIGTSMGLAILLVGSSAILSLELAYLMRRRMTHASLPRALGPGPGLAMRTPAEYAIRPHHSARDRPGRRPWRHGST